MLTLYTVPKPFRGYTGGIQHNAITSWTLLRPRPEIILFGDEEGIAKAAKELNVCHIPEVACNEYGTPLLHKIFEKAQLLASHDLLCYVNADIILMSDFMRAVEQVARHRHRFLIIGRRWDVNLRESWDFHQPEWESKLRVYVNEHAKLHSKTGIDYFVFPKGLWGKIPPFAVGRPAWDNWMIYRALSLRVSVIDATRVITVIHQNHDYSHVLGGVEIAREGPEARENLRLAGGYTYMLNISDATHYLTTKSVNRNFSKDYLFRCLNIAPVLYPQLNPLYRSLRIFSKSLARLFRKLV